jgi:hypothetical protein
MIYFIFSFILSVFFQAMCKPVYNILGLMGIDTSKLEALGNAGSFATGVHPDIKKVRAEVYACVLKV